MVNESDTGQDAKGNQRTKRRQVTITEEADQIIDNLVRAYGFCNRSEAIDCLIKGYGSEFPWLSENEGVSGSEPVFDCDKAPRVVSLVTAIKVWDPSDVDHVPWCYQLNFNTQYIGTIKAIQESCEDSGGKGYWNVCPQDEGHLVFGNGCEKNRSRHGSLADGLLYLLDYYYARRG